MPVIPQPISKEGTVPSAPRTYYQTPSIAPFIDLLDEESTRGEILEVWDRILELHFPKEDGYKITHMRKDDLPRMDLLELSGPGDEGASTFFVINCKSSTEGRYNPWFESAGELRDLLTEIQEERKAMGITYHLRAATAVGRKVEFYTLAEDQTLRKFPPQIPDLDIARGHYRVQDILDSVVNYH